MDNISEVVKTKACSNCGMCVAACPENAIKIEEECTPEVRENCIGCGICYEICPRVQMPYTIIERELAVRNRADKHDEFIGN